MPKMISEWNGALISIRNRYKSDSRPQVVSLLLLQWFLGTAPRCQNRPMVPKWEQQDLPIRRTIRRQTQNKKKRVAKQKGPTTTDQPTTPNKPEEPRRKRCHRARPPAPADPPNHTPSLLLINIHPLHPPFTLTHDCAGPPPCFPAPGVVKQHISICYNFSDRHYFLEVVIWSAPEHHLWNHDFVIIFISGALVIVRQHISIFCIFRNFI